MPFTGGYSPSPERTGGGDAGSAAPRLQRIFESIAARRGPAFDPTDNSLVGAENMAYARAIDADVYGANERFVNEMVPALSTVGGNLPRWERIFGVSPVPGDTQVDRQQRVARAAAKFAARNTPQGVTDALSDVLGALFVGLTLITPTEANTWWPGLAGAAATIASVAGNLVTITGLAAVPSDAAGKTIVVANANDPANDGTFPIQSRVSATSVVYVNNGAPSAPDYGVGGTAFFPTVQWSLVNAVRPWTSTLAHVLVQVDPFAVPGYADASGVLTGAFFRAVAEMNSILDWLLPADATFDWYVASSHGGPGWYLDEPNLDLEIFDG